MGLQRSIQVTVAQQELTSIRSVHVGLVIGATPIQAIEIERWRAKIGQAIGIVQLYQAAEQTKKLSGFSRTEILPEPQVLLTPSPKLPGTDGRKMSKS